MQRASNVTERRADGKRRVAFGHATSRFAKRLCYGLRFAVCPLRGFPNHQTGPDYTLAVGGGLPYGPSSYLPPARSGVYPDWTPFGKGRSDSKLFQTANRRYNQCVSEP